MKWLALALLVAAVAAAVWLGGTGEAVDEDLPDAPPQAGFVGSETCKECHPDRHETWLDTAHAYSLRKPSEGSVRGRFDGKPILSRYFRATPYEQDGEYYIRVEGRDGRPSADHRVTRVVGRTFEQAYLLKGPKGEWRVLPICWSIEREEWDLTHRVLASILGDSGTIPDDYDTRNNVFNHGCGQCHATDYDVGYDIDTGTYRSRMLEGAVACETCHGPGSVHADWHAASDDPGGAGAGSDRAYERPARLVHPREDLDAQGVLDTCGRCHYLHEWRYAIDSDPLVSHHEIAMSRNLDRAGFFADGRLSGLNYHGTTQSQSACFLKGAMSCLDCHRMHARRDWAMKFSGNSDQQCAKCHGGIVEKPKEHSFHAEARCVDCHMPKFMAGVLHFARDHSISSPEPELTERFGDKQVPNACNLCHDDRTAAWAREHKEKWWKPAPRRLVDDVGMVVRLRREPEGVETDELAAAAARAESRLFFRMTALKHLARRDTPDAASAVRATLEQDNVELLQIACEALSLRPDPLAVPALLRLVDHPVRTVRVEAAYALALAGWRGRTAGIERAYRDAVAMNVRQRPIALTLLRIASLADLAGDSGGFARAFDQLVRVAKWPAAQWPRDAIDLLHRRARRVAEEGEPARALPLYDQVRTLAGKPIPELLFLDSADGLLESGERVEARGVWKFVVDHWDEKSDLRTVAEARLAALDGPAAAELERLRALAERLEAEPASGRLLRRVRWSIRAIEQR